MADSDDERDILQCDDRRFKAMVRDDLATLRMALAPCSGLLGGFLRDIRWLCRE